MPITDEQVKAVLFQAQQLVKQLEGLVAQQAAERAAPVSEGQPAPRYSRLT